MRLGWGIAIGALVGGGLAWWLSRDTPTEAARKQARAEAARNAEATDARPVLYRWRDGNGILQITSQPPKDADAGRAYERIDLEPRTGIEVHGDRQ